MPSRLPPVRRAARFLKAFFDIVEELQRERRRTPARKKAAMPR